MLKLLEEVASRRLKLNLDKFTIQISSTLMNKAVDEINKILPQEKQLKQDETMNEFQYVMFEMEWTIKNRSYRDDTNDIDVEKVMCELLDSNKELNALIISSFGICCNANDFFNYACADSVIIDSRDLIWALPIFKKYEFEGLDACMSFIAKKKPIKPYITEKFEQAYSEIEKMNPEVNSEY